jgi:hypothetical protein
MLRYRAPLLKGLKPASIPWQTSAVVRGQLRDATLLDVQRQARVVRGELLADEADRVLEPLEVALVAAADVLNATAPPVRTNTGLILHHNAQKE